MKCRYCGKDLRCVNDTLYAATGAKCAGNAQGCHVALSDGNTCIYCGRPTRIVANKLSTVYGFKCKNSPTGGHCLQ